MLKNALLEAVVVFSCWSKSTRWQYCNVNNAGCGETSEKKKQSLSGWLFAEGGWPFWKLVPGNLRTQPSTVNKRRTLSG